jgi:glycosyltransferase involved in cell wall biosynthesis
MSGVFVRDHARAAALHHRVAVLAPEPTGRGYRPFRLTSSEDELPTMQVHYRRSRIPLGTGGAYTAGVLASLRRLARSGFRPDLIHAHVYEVGLAALLAGERYRVPVILSEHSSHFSLGTLSDSAVRRARFVFRRADLVCPVSEDLRRRLEARGFQGSFRVVPNPVDTEVFRPSPPPSAGPVTAVFVGGLDPVKRVDMLLRALAGANGLSIRLEVVGDGPVRRELEQLATALDLRGAVRFWGYLSRDGVAERIRSAHFLVLPSKVETFGIALAEALVVGRPVVATRTGAIPELVDERSGTLVPPGDVAALAAAVAAMAHRHHEFQWRLLSSDATARFGLAAVGRQWDDVYRSLAA